MQEITDYLNEVMEKGSVDTGKLWQEIMGGNLAGGVKEFAMQR